jgi:hypothetical protein
MDSGNDEPRLRRERAVPLNVPIPYQLRDRLDAILHELDQAGADTTLKEVVAMLLFHAEEDRKTLFDMWLAYRNAPPEAAAFAKEDGNILPFRQRKRGRPTRPAG